MKAISILNFSFLFPIIITAQINLWEITNGPIDGKVWCIEINSNDEIFACDDAKLYKSSNEGDDWDLILDLTGEASEIVKIICNSNNDIMLATFGGAGFYKSYDEGKTWITPSQNLIGVNDLELDHLNNLIAATLFGVYISTDDGVTWELRTNGILGQPIIVSVFVDSRNNYFIGTYSSDILIYKSTDIGFTWFPSSSGINTLAVISIVETTDTFLIAGSSDFFGIHRSTDFGNSWNFFNEGLPITSADYKVLRNNLNHIYLGLANGGVFRSINGGLSWSDFNTGLSNSTVLSLCINSAGKLFAGTWGDGVFRTISSTTSIEPEASNDLEFFLKCFPNPFNSVTNIEFEITKGSYVSVEVYNVIGQKMLTTINDYYENGTHTHKLFMDNMSSGVYFLNIHVFDKFFIHKIINIK